MDPLLHFQNLRNRLGNWGGREAGFGGLHAVPRCFHTFERINGPVHRQAEEGGRPFPLPGLRPSYHFQPAQESGQEMDGLGGGANQVDTRQLQDTLEQKAGRNLPLLLTLSHLR